MKGQAVVIGIVLFAIAIVGGVKYYEHQKRQSSIDDIKAAYSALADAYAQRQGEAAAKFMTEKSFEYYGSILQLGLNAPESRVKELSPHQLNEVLLMRTHAKRKELANLDGRKYFVHVVNNGWWLESGDPLDVKSVLLHQGWAEIVLHNQEWADAYREQQIGGVLTAFAGRRGRVLGRAAAREPRLPPPVELRLRAFKEADGWKICDASSAPALDQYIENLAQIEGFKGRELVIAWHEEVNGGQLENSVWKPMR